MTTDADGSIEPSERRTAGLEMMHAVYGFNIAPEHVTNRYVAMTVDHLFGEVWTGEALGIRDRRMLTIGVLAAQHMPQLLEIQFGAALERGELTPEQVREAVVHIAHYIGWPMSTSLQAAAEKSIAAHTPSDADG